MDSGTHPPTWASVDWGSNSFSIGPVIISKLGHESSEKRLYTPMINVIVIKRLGDSQYDRQRQSKVFGNPTTQEC